MRAWILGFAIVVASAPGAATPTAVDAEIDYLLGQLQQSGCSFQRNGKWHESTEARQHLQRKREHIAKRQAIADTESFIAKAATQSSMSGKPYQVRCGDAPVQSSRTWLMRELQTYRAARD